MPSELLDQPWHRAVEHWDWKAPVEHTNSTLPLAHGDPESQGVEVM